MKQFRLALAALALMASSAAAHASITGDTIDLQFLGVPAPGTVFLLEDYGTFVVPGTGVATGSLADFGFTYTLTSTSLTLTQSGALVFDHDPFYGYDFVDETKGYSTDIVTLDASSTVGGTAPVGSFAGANLYINFEGANFAPGDTAVFDFSSTVTPEPSGLLLLGTGVFATAGSMRRRFRRA